MAQGTIGGGFRRWFSFSLSLQVIFNQGCFMVVVLSLTAVFNEFSVVVRGGSHSQAGDSGTRVVGGGSTCARLYSVWVTGFLIQSF